MLKSTRAAVAIGLGLVGVAGMAGFARGQDPAVRQTGNGAGATKPTAPAPAGPAIVGTIDFDSVVRNYNRFKAGVEAVNAEGMNR